MFGDNVPVFGTRAQIPWCTAQSRAPV